MWSPVTSQRFNCRTVTVRSVPATRTYHTFHYSVEYPRATFGTPFTLETVTTFTGWTKQLGAICLFIRFYSTNCANQRNFDPIPQSHTIVLHRSSNLI